MGKCLEDIWQKRCSCGKCLKKKNKSGMCRYCYTHKWKKKNYNGRKPEGYSVYVAVSE